MKVLRILILSLTTLLLYSCSTEEDLPSPVEPAVTPSEENVYFSHNQWIYAVMNKHYLWREDMPDSISCNYDQTPDEFFNGLLSSKDRFSYMLNNPYYSPTEYVNPGFAYQTYQDKYGNRAEYILYVSDENIKSSYIQRGKWIKLNSKEVSSISFNPVNLENDIFIYDDKTITQSISNPTKQSTVLLDSIYPGNIGYLCYTEFDNIADLIPSLTKFKNSNISNLILDLRYNPGGYVKTCKYLANCIASENAYGNIFQVTKYNDIIAKENILETGKAELYDNFGFPTSNPANNKGGYPIIPLNLSSLYVLTSSHTASASEATILCLKPYMDVIQIGETTVGKGVGSYTIYDKQFKYALQPITMQYYNQSGETVSNDGLAPDIFIADGYSISKKNIGEDSEPLLQAALSVINGFVLDNSSLLLSRSGVSSLTPIGEPSYVTEFNNKHYNESN